MHMVRAADVQVIRDRRDRALPTNSKFSTFQRWSAALFFLLSLFVLYFSSNHSYSKDERKLVFTYPAVFSGDEPHYLLIIASILFDRDLYLTNNYHSARVGRADAGQKVRGWQLDHHTLIKDVRTGDTVLWEEVFDYRGGDPKCVPTDLSCVGFSRISNLVPDYNPANPNYVELPKHPFTFPALLALGLRLLHTGRDEVEAHAVYLNVLLSWSVGIVAYFCALGLGLGSGESMGVVLLTYFASPWLVYSHLLFPATFMGLLVTAALWTFLRNRFVLSATLLAVASMQSEAFILIFPTWALLLYLSEEKTSAWVFTGAGAIAIALATAINHMALGKATLRTMGFSFHPVTWRTFLDPGTGVWLFIPWSIPAFLFLVLSFSARRDAGTRALQAMALGIFPVAVVYMIIPWSGQFCYGPRYWVPFIPWLSLALVLGMRHYQDVRSSWVRPLLLLLVGLSVVIVLTATIVPGSASWHEPPWRPLWFLLQR
jgi:hypothetical protein